MARRAIREQWYAMIPLVPINDLVGRLLPDDFPHTLTNAIDLAWINKRVIEADWDLGNPPSEMEETHYYASMFSLLLSDAFTALPHGTRSEIRQFLSLERSGPRRVGNSIGKSFSYPRQASAYARAQ
jgi:hypothetical protein